MMQDEENPVRRAIREAVMSTLFDVADELAKNDGWEKGDDCDPPDITAYELALCMPALCNRNTASYVGLPPEAKRHWMKLEAGG